MTRGKPILVLTWLLVILPIALAAGCPNKEDVAPCTCDEWYSVVTIECHGIDNEGLARLASNLRGMKFDALSIQESKFGIIPHDVFKGVSFRRLDIDKSTLVALTDRDEAFVGLEDHLEELNIRHNVIENEWDWTVLRNLKKVKELRLPYSFTQKTLGTDAMISTLSSSLEVFAFSGNNVSVISDHAFSSFKDLSRLTLSENEITNVKRTMLPDPALKLVSFSLSYNLIEEFPEDMFSNMPILDFLYISYNKILVLEEKTFSTIFGRLFSLSSLGNAHNCDCRMSWIRWNKPRNGIDGKCASPPRLRGKNLEDLKYRDFDNCNA